MSRSQNVDMEETEVGRVRRKLKKLMDKRDEKLRPKSGVSGSHTAVTLTGVKASKSVGSGTERSGSSPRQSTSLADASDSKDSKDKDLSDTPLTSALSNELQVPKLKEGSLYKELTS